MLESALLVIRGIERDANEQHHDRQKDDAGKKVHDLEFTYFDRCDARLGDEQGRGRHQVNAPNAAINQRVGFPLVGVEISQPTRVISVTTIIPSQNLR